MEQVLLSLYKLKKILLHGHREKESSSIVIHENPLGQEISFRFESKRESKRDFLPDSVSRLTPVYPFPRLNIIECSSWQRLLSEDKYLALGICLNGQRPSDECSVHVLSRFQWKISKWKLIAIHAFPVFLYKWCTFLKSRIDFLSFCVKHLTRSRSTNYWQVSYGTIKRIMPWIGRINLDTKPFLYVKIAWFRTSRLIYLQYSISN